MTSLPSITPSADAAFNQWALVRATMPRGRLSEISIQKHRTIWDIWLRHLANSGTPWHLAEAHQARDFLLQVAPRRKGLAHESRQVSPVTQARYWKILQSIYSVAVSMAWLNTSPFVLESKVAHSEAQDSLVFNTLDWALLLAELPAPSLAMSHWAEVRDRALLLLMMQCGLSVSELKTLRLDDVLFAQADDAVTTLELNIHGNRPDQHRSLPVPALAAQALQDYLSLRAHMPQDNPLVFVRQRGGTLASAYKNATLASKSIYVMTASYVRQVLGSRYPQLAHAGPTSLRNTCIVRWLDEGRPDTQVLRDAGLKDPQALQRLRKHVVRSALDQS